MKNEVNRRIVLAARPVGEPKDGDFRLEEAEVPKEGEGELLCRVIYLSLDPYMRGRMNEGPSYANPVGIGEPMTGRTVSEVVRSNAQGVKPGSIVFSEEIGWQEWGVVSPSAAGFRVLDPSLAPISAALGTLGMPGLTAYVGMLDIGRPKEGETVVVSAASGAVGAVAGQLARERGCRVVGVAGAPEKCDYVIDELGFDTCVSHRSETLSDDLAESCPNGIDVYFENVGGKVFSAVLPLFNPFARVPVCGAISGYNATGPGQGPDMTQAILVACITKRLTMRGFVVGDHRDRFDAFHDEVSALVREGRLKYREDVADGLGNAVAAFQGLLKGRNFGKQLVRVGDDPTR